MAVQVAGGAWLGNERGLEERSPNPSIPSARNRATHLATVFGVVLYRRATTVLFRPPSTTVRTIGSRPRGVRRAFLWLFIWSLPGTLKLRKPQFPRFRPDGQPAERPQLDDPLLPQRAEVVAVQS